MTADRRVAELDFLRAALVVGVVLFHAVHVFDPLDFSVKSDVEWEFLVPFILFASLRSRGHGRPSRGSPARRAGAGSPASCCWAPGWSSIRSSVGRVRVPAVPRWVNDAVLPVYVLHQTVVVVLAWRHPRVGRPRRCPTAAADRRLGGRHAGAVRARAADPRGRRAARSAEEVVLEGPDEDRRAGAVLGHDVTLEAAQAHGRLA